MCVETVGRLAKMWEISSGEDRQDMVRMLFDYIEYNLDARRITDFRLKPWADNFLVLRSALYEKENPQNSEGGKEDETGENGTKSSGHLSTPGGIRTPDLVLRRHLLYPLSYGGE